MNLPPATCRRPQAISSICCLLGLVLVAAVVPSRSANAALMTFEQSVSSAQMLSTIEGGETQLGGLSIWYDVALSDPYASDFSNAAARRVGSQSDGMGGGRSDSSEEPLAFSILPCLDFCVFASSSGNGSTSGFSSNGSSAGQGGSVLAAILVPQMRFPVPVLNHFWRGADFLFVPPVVPDELLRPPQI